MENIMMDQLFKAPERTRNRFAGKHYDVRITLNKSGGGRQCIRFGFINKGAAEAGKHSYAEASDIEYLKSRIYFRFHETRVSSNVHTLSVSSSKKPINRACYFTITPNEKAEKLYRMNWIGKTFMLQYDEDLKLYYVENKEN